MGHTLPFGIARRTDHYEVGRSRRKRLGRDLWSADQRPSGGTDEAQFPPALDEYRHGVAALGGVARRILHQQRHRDFEGVDPCTPGDLQPQGLQHLRDDEHGPNLLLDDRRLGRPQQVQLQVLFDQQHGQLDVPPPRIQPGHLQRWQDRGVQDVGDILVQRVPHPEADQPGGMRGPVGPMRAQPDDPIEGLARLVEDVDDRVARLGPRRETQ